MAYEPIRPNALDTLPYGGDLLITPTAALQAGNFLNLPQVRTENVTLDADSAGLGHHAIHTKADVEAEGMILNVIHPLDPNAYVMTEESKLDEESTFPRDQIVTPENIGQALSSGETMYVVDPLDGTAQHKQGSFVWGVSVGRIRKGGMDSGSIFAPRLGGGLFVTGSLLQGAYVLEHDQGEAFYAAPDLSEPVELGNARVLHGVDLALPAFSDYKEAMFVVADQALVTLGSGSSAAGLAEVVSGAAGLFINPEQKPWDVAAGKPLIEAAGGKWLWFKRYAEIDFIDDLDMGIDFAPDKRIGFVAGRPNLVDQARETLENFVT